MKKTKIMNRMYDVIPEEKFNHSMDSKMVAVEFDGMVYPIRNNDLGPGLYKKNKTVSFYIDPPQEDIEDYKASNCIDFDNASNMKELIKFSEQLKEMEKSVLVSSDNIFKPKISPDDEPEMKLFKQAIIEKNIEIEKYEHRFSQYSNDIRLFKRKDITFNKLKPMCDNFDMELYLTIKDKPGAVNPIGRTLTIKINGDKEKDDE